MRKGFAREGTDSMDLGWMTIVLPLRFGWNQFVGVRPVRDGVRGTGIKKEEDGE